MFARDFRPKWIAGNVVMVTGPLSYEIELIAGGRIRRHVVYGMLTIRNAGIVQIGTSHQETQDSSVSRETTEGVDVPSPTPPSSGTPSVRRSSRESRPICSNGSKLTVCTVL